MWHCVIMIADCGDFFVIQGNFSQIIDVFSIDTRVRAWYNWRIRRVLWKKLQR